MASEDGFEIGEVWPITLERAAEKLHWKNVRSLKVHCRVHSLGRKVGRKIVFSLYEFQDLYNTLRLIRDPRPLALSHRDAGRPRAAPTTPAPKAKRRGRRGPRNWLKPGFTPKSE